MGNILHFLQICCYQVDLNYNLKILNYDERVYNLKNGH